MAGTISRLPIRSGQLSEKKSCEDSRAGFARRYTATRAAQSGQLWIKRHYFLASGNKLAERIQQRPQEFLIRPPALHRRLVDRLACLRHAGSADRAFVLVEVEAGIVPLQPAVFDNAPRLRLLVRHDVLIL